METKFVADIDANEILTQNEKETTPKTNSKNVAYDTKNYLSVILPEGQKSKTLTIRLLPFSPEGGSPFKKVIMHTVKVNKEVSPSGWKKLVCPLHNDIEGKEKTKCPFCETSEEASRMENEESDPIKKKNIDDIRFANQPKEMWIVRCIDRDNESDGVKFWMFPSSKKNDGIYNKIYNIFKTKSEIAKKKGQTCNIFSLTEGKDLIVTITRSSDGKRVTTIVDDDEKTPLSNDVELANKWITDPKKWSDVFTTKPYEYMEILLEGKVPIWDNDSKKYVEKLSQQEYKAKKETELQEEIKKNESVMQTLSGNTASASVSGTTNKGDDEELPF